MIPTWKLEQLAVFLWGIFLGGMLGLALMLI